MVVPPLYPYWSTFQAFPRYTKSDIILKSTIVPKRNFKTYSITLPAFTIPTKPSLSYWFDQILSIHYLLIKMMLFLNPHNDHTTIKNSEYHIVFFFPWFPSAHHNSNITFILFSTTQNRFFHLRHIHQNFNVNWHFRNKCSTISIAMLQKTHIRSASWMMLSWCSESLVFILPIIVNHTSSSALGGATPF